MVPERRFLDIAARAALRAAGDVEPNPLVGAVIARGDTMLAVGHHRRFGGPHAEREAIAACRAAGHDPAGATMYVTLEPCAHHGKTPPCTDALIEAGIRRVVVAREDPTADARGGAAALRAAGIDVRFTAASPLATHLADPFIVRRSAQRPWVIAKWAQTIDGKVAAATGQSKWISSDASRRLVHRIRARVDGVLTGIGTVRADNPMLTARGVARTRRLARRIVIDPRLEIDPGAALITTAADVPTIVLCGEIAARSDAARRFALEAAGVRVVATPEIEDDATGVPSLDLAWALGYLSSAFDVNSILVEAGPGLVGALFRRGLVDEAIVFIAPMILGDPAAPGPAAIGPAPALADATGLTLARVSHRGGDAVMWLRAIR